MPVMKPNKRERGYVKFFIPEKKYGFIVVMDGSEEEIHSDDFDRKEEIFFHVSKILFTEDKLQNKNLKVSFERGDNRGKLIAVNIDLD